MLKKRKRSDSTSIIVSPSTFGTKKSSDYRLLEDNISEEDVLKEFNFMVIKSLLLVSFFNEEKFKIVVYKKWLSIISTKDEKSRDADLRRILTKIGTSRGDFEFGPRYIQFFGESNRRATPESQELHLPGEMINEPIIGKMLAVMTRFCPHVKTELVTNRKTFGGYRYNALLTEVLDSMRTSIIAHFLNFFVIHYNNSYICGTTEEITNLSAKRTCICVTLDRIFRDMTAIPSIAIIEMMNGILKQNPPEKLPYFIVTPRHHADSISSRISMWRDKKKLKRKIDT